MSPFLGVQVRRPPALVARRRFTEIDDQPTDPNARLVSLGFVSAALRRSAWFWGHRCRRVADRLRLVREPAPSYQASTTLLLTEGPRRSPATAILDDQAIAQSHAVAGLALHKLGLQQSVGSFLSRTRLRPLPTGFSLSRPAHHRATTQ